MQVTFHVTGNAEKYIAAAERQLSSPMISEFLREAMIPWLKTRAMVRFKQLGDDASGPWEPLKEATKSLRRKQGYPDGPANIRTGRMLRYIMTDRPNIHRTGSEVYTTFPSPPNGEMGNKFQVAQLGTSRPPTVARPVLAVSSLDSEFAIKALWTRIARSI